MCTRLTEQVSAISRRLEDSAARVTELESKERGYVDHIRELTSSMRTLSATVVALKRTASQECEDFTSMQQQLNTQLADQADAHQAALKELRAHMRQVCGLVCADCKEPLQLPISFSLCVCMRACGNQTQLDSDTAVKAEQVKVRELEAKLASIPASASMDVTLQAPLLASLSKV